MGFKITCFILSLGVFAHGFPLSDENHIGVDHDNHLTFDSGHRRPDCVNYGSREFDSDELGDFGSGPLDPRELGGKTLEPIRFAPPCPSDLDGREGFDPIPKPDFGPEHLGPEASEPNRPEEFDDKHFGPEKFGPELVGPEDFSAGLVGPKGFKPQHVGPEEFKHKNNDYEGFTPEHIGPEGFGPWHVGPEQFEPEHLEPEGLGPKHFGFEQLDHELFVRSRAGDIKNDHFRLDQAGPGNIERRHFDINHFVPRIG